MKALLKLAPALVLAALAAAPVVTSGRLASAQEGDEKKGDDKKGDEKKPGGPGVSPGSDDEKKDDDEPKKGDDKKGDDKKGDDKKGDDKKDADKVDTESLEAKTLAGKLHVPPNWRPKLGTVELSYGFHEEPQLLDWKWQGADRCEPTGSGLELGLGSSACAVGLLESVELAGDFELNLSVNITWASPANDFIILFGVKKGGEGFGLRYGNQFVKVKGDKIYKITKNEPASGKFGLDRTVDMRIVRKGDEIRTWINKVDAGSQKYKKKELDGKVGLLAGYNMRLRVSKFDVKGVIDKSKL
jgi:hypothetical protein